MVRYKKRVDTDDYSYKRLSCSHLITYKVGKLITYVHNCKIHIRVVV